MIIKILILKITLIIFRKSFYKNVHIYKRENNNHNAKSSKYKVKKASMTVELNGGQSSRFNSRPGFNIKIRDNDNLYGRSQIKLRSDSNEATYLRTKIATDIHNYLELPSIASNYATLYINDEYMGLYILMDSYKLSWVEYEYGEKNTKYLYKCDGSAFLTLNTLHNCINENDNVKDKYKKKWVELITTIDKANSAADIEEIFDIDQFLIEIAIEYLLGSYDHFLQTGRNYYMFKPPLQKSTKKNKINVISKWKYLLHDFDHEFGQDMDMIYRDYIFEDLPDLTGKYDYPKYSFSNSTKYNHLINILILKNPRRFDKILKDVVTRVFNPAILFPRIDKLKNFIRPYVILDKTPNANGKYPGRLNEASKEFYSLSEWDANSEFTTIKTLDYNAYGLKYWILEKYRYICKTYKMKCDSKYLDDKYKYTINKEVEFKGYDTLIESFTINAMNNTVISTMTSIPTIKNNNSNKKDEL